MVRKGRIIMKQNINFDKLYTDKIAEYLDRGYWINPASMHGSEWGDFEFEDIDLKGDKRMVKGHYSVQSRVDMTNGREFITVAVIERSYHGLKTDKRVRNIEVLKAPKKARPNDFWVGNCEVIWCFETYEIAYDFYGTKEQAEAAVQVRRERHSRPVDKDSFGEYKSFNTPLAKAYVLPFVQRQRGFKSATMKDITEVFKVVEESGRHRWKSVSYRVKCKGKVLVLNANGIVRSRIA